MMASSTPRLLQQLLSADFLLRVTITSLLCWQASAWGSDENTNTAVFGNSLSRDWLYNSKVISMQLEGCMWGYVEDNEESGCMENGSEDGTTYWYQMANCRRAQAVYSLYATDSGSSASCSTSHFKESFVTKGGLSEFIYYLAEYDSNNPFGDDYSGDDAAGDDAAGDDGNYGGNDGYEDLPQCEQGQNGYIGLGCADDGTFSLQYFNDEYCLQPAGQTYDRLKSLNRALKTYKSCTGIWYNNGGGEGSLPYYLVSTSDSCSSLDSGFCVDNSAMKERRSHTSSNILSRNRFASGKTWVTKLKYATGGLLLLASFVMFTGILFTNRRRRRALMQRKYRQSRRDGSRRSKSSRSKSKSRREGESSRKSSRSRSRAKREEGGGGGGEGVFA